MIRGELARIRRCEKNITRWEREIGEQLREWRRVHRLTLRSAAKRMNVSAPFLCDVELGRRPISDAMLNSIEKLII